MQSINLWLGIRTRHAAMAVLFFVLSIGAVVDRSLGQTSDRIKFMSHEQEGKIRRLVNKTQGEQSQLKKLLSEENEKLGQLYGQFALDEKRIEASHQAIVELEQKLLKTHLVMHRELRTIIGPEIYSEIAKRLKIMMEKQIPAASKQTGPISQ